MIEVLIGSVKFLQQFSLSLLLGIYIINGLQQFKKLDFNLFVLCLLTINIIFIPITLQVQTFYYFESNSSLLNLEALKTVAYETRYGNIWIIRSLLLLILVSIIYILKNVKSRNYLIYFFISILIATPSFYGHSSSYDTAYISIPINFLHILSISAWFGSLPFLMLNIFDNNNDINKNLLIKFSKFATSMIVIAILSGLFLTIINLDYRFAALLGTAYGQILIAKIVLIIFAMSCAIYIRLTYLKNYKTTEKTINIRTKNIRYVIIIEIIFALLTFFIGILLTQIIPGAHDEIIWPLNFRISVDVAMENQSIVKIINYLILLSSLVIGLLVTDYLINKNLIRFITLLLPSTIILGTISIYLLSVEAYSATYKTPNVPYSAISVSNGKKIYRDYCISCHGFSAQGDGELADSIEDIKPANLTEPHTAYHTAGDIYWWLTYGMPPSVMPGFNSILTEDERWDLINYLRTLSAGYEARIITDNIISNKPWLPAIDFDFVTYTGIPGRLSQYRLKKSIILIIYSENNRNKDRLNKLTKVYDDIKNAGGEILLVPYKKDKSVIQNLNTVPFPIVFDGSEEITDTYNLYRRTLAFPDKKDIKENIDYMELLIDKYGYIRSRWLYRIEKKSDNTSRYVEMVKFLEKEGKILPPPDEHVH